MWRERLSTTDRFGTQTSSVSRRRVVVVFCFLFFLKFYFSDGCLNLQLVLTPTHLSIVMEYAAGGELFERICNAGRFSEDEVVTLSLFSLE
jgi:hypothetical protein